MLEPSLPIRHTKSRWFQQAKWSDRKIWACFLYNKYDELIQDEGKVSKWIMQKQHGYKQT